MLVLVWEAVFAKTMSFNYFSTGNEHLFAVLAGRKGISSQV